MSNSSPADLALQTSELSYRRFFEASKNGLLILNVATGRIDDANPFLVELLGFSRAELVGKSVWELGLDCDLVANKAMFDTLQHQGYVRYANLPLETRSGRTIAVEFISNIYQAGDANVIQCNIRDISHHPQSDDKLRLSEERYRRLFETAHDGILILNPKTRKIIDVNPFMIEFLGYSREEFIGRELWEIGMLKDEAASRQAFAELQEKHFIRYGDLPLETKNGQRREVEFVSNLYAENSHQVIQCNIRDLTGRKQAEDQLRISECRYRRLFETAHDGILLLNPQTRKIIDVNPFMIQFLGYSHEEFLGRELWEIGLLKDEAASRRAFAELQEKHFIRYEDLPLETKTGQRREVEFVSNLYAENSHEVIQCNIRDLTGRRQAEQEIRRLNETLELRVASRTNELVASNKELETFSYSVSHDLRAPVRQIMGFVELLRKDAAPVLSEKNLRYLTTISESARKMGNLIDDLLAFSQLGRAKLKRTSVNLNQLVKEIVDDFQTQTRSRSISWEIGSLPAVLADRALLRQVLVNLLANAVKFTATRPSAIIEIGRLPGELSDDGSLSDSGEPVRKTVIFVRDNGVGFDPQYVGTLFAMFARLHDGAEFEGTGIGLAIVQRIIHRHGGRAWAQGALDGGATFYFSLPLTNNEPPK